ncbi:peroxisomal biogenesis factor 19 [Neocloeon triangulifer]|uniref:peroxisomal biogenesis factor 19 n=1 Tax=Neocloeon triangulifer TaxID=2078957 RepID=UPI00286F625A|nr:peroxisomal biogenesis factor 19 [Neocloeon triangulifer]
MASGGKGAVVPPEECEEDLDELLCDALDDLKKPAEEQAPAKKEKIKAPTGLPSELEHAWNEEFAAQFQKYLQCEGGENAEAVAASLQEMTEAAANALRHTGADTPMTPSSEDPVSAAIAQTLKNLADNANSLQSPLTENEIMNMFGSFGLSDGPNGDSDIFPFMQNMMQSLLSKDVLLPALQGILEKYPGWLDENRATLPEEKIANIVRQQELMKKVCEELEKESASDTDDVKSKRFDKVLDLMQQMQECGLPPAELTGELPGDLGATMSNPDQPQCSIM